MGETQLMKTKNLQEKPKGFQKPPIQKSRRQQQPLCRKKSPNKTRPQLCEHIFLTHIWKVIGDWRVNSQPKMNTEYTRLARACVFVRAHEYTYEHRRWY